MPVKIHAAAGLLGFLLIVGFWSSTVLSELFGSPDLVARVKATILWGMAVLIPALALAGASGMAIGRKRRDAPALAKKKRMPFIALNGLLILMPAAVFLAARSQVGLFDAWFYGVQAIEIIAGATNMVLLGLNIRDGMRMAGHRRQVAAR